MQPDAGGDVAGRGAHQPEHHADGGERQERIRDPRRTREQLQRPGEELEPAVRRDLLRRDVIAGEEMRDRIEERRQQHGGARARFALDRAVHGPTQERLLDQRDRKPAQRAQRDEPEQGGARHGRAAAPFEQAQHRHEADRRRHARHAQRNGEGHLAQKRAPREPVAEAPAIGESEIPRQSEKADEERQHADALADTVEGEVEMRIEECPRRVGEHRDAEERRGAQPEKPRKGPHRRFTTRLPPPPRPE